MTPPPPPPPPHALNSTSVEIAIPAFSPREKDLLTLISFFLCDPRGRECQPRNSKMHHPGAPFPVPKRNTPCPMTNARLTANRLPLLNLQ
jgi:hypothetical protein